MSKLQQRSLLALALAGTMAVANAGTITIGSTAVAAPTKVENFDGVIPPRNNVTTQFARSGLNLTTLSGTGAALIDNSSCRNSGVTDSYLYIGVNAPCSESTATDGVAIKFGSAVSELSWTGFNRAGSAGFDIAALYQGAVVSSIVFNSANTFENKTVLFTGSIFDELRFTEKGANERFFALDNLSWKTASVPLPGTLPLLFIGLAGACVALRKARKA